MNNNDHLIGLGKLVGSLQGLEVLLRVFLCTANGQDMKFPKGDESELAENYLTNPMSLGELIKAYNIALSCEEADSVVDMAAVTVRDAIAHGRLMSAAEGFPLTLYRFGRRPENGKVKVDFVDVMSTEWFDEKRQLVRDQMDKVVSCSLRRGYRSIGKAK